MSLVPWRKQQAGVTNRQDIVNVRSGGLDAGSVLGSMLLSGTITANEIAANTITADEILAGSITTTELDFTPYVIGTNTADDVVDGGTYSTVLNTHLDANGIKISALTTFDGEWYSESGVDINATTGINIYGNATGLTTRPTKAGTVQCSVNAAGQIIAGAGAVLLDAGGIQLRGTAGNASMLTLAKADGTARGYLFYHTGLDEIRLVATSVQLSIASGTDYILMEDHTIPSSDSSYDLGENSTPKRWRTAYIDTFEDVVASSSIWWRDYHLGAASASPGASGAVAREPTTQTVGGWQLDLVTEHLYYDVHVEGDWDGASDPIIEVWFEYNDDNTGGNAADQITLDCVCRMKAPGETAIKTQSLTDSVTIGASDRYKMFKASFTLDWNAGGATVEVGDVIGIHLNMDIPNSSVSSGSEDIIVNYTEFKYKTALPHEKV